METRTDCYGRVAALLHWLIGALLLGQIGFGFLLDTLAPRGTPSRASVINLHKSIGIAIGILIVVRVLWRLRHRPPAWPPGMSMWQRRAATLGHRALYVCMVLMPTSGYIASNFSRHGVRFFGSPMPPWGPDLPGVYAALNLLHISTAWVFSVLIAGHVAIALKHALIDRDHGFARMLPRRSGPPAATAHHPTHSREPA